ncbi:MAG: RNA-directed DNA polymerase [Hyphomonadaceae bacterium]|nr:RNA-directed DNA polymerase [Hyphomonadaceae bacterium]
MASSTTIAKGLAAALVAGVWTERALLARCEGFLGAATRASQKKLISALLVRAYDRYPHSPASLVRWLLRSPAFERAAAPLLRAGPKPPVVLKPPLFWPAPPLAGLDVPKLATPRDLADWLEISVEQLDWFACAKRQAIALSFPKLRHYECALVRKRSGGSRLIEAPRRRLKAIQRRLLREVLDHVPTSDRAYGFVRGRSCIDGAQVHAAEEVVVTLDLQRFFQSIAARRVHATFRGIGYPWAVARLLTGLCTTRAPSWGFADVPYTEFDWRARKMLEAPHLPQGAPTSPTLANLAAWRLDRRLAGLARRLDANYTRYADDLAFSGRRNIASPTFLRAVGEIVVDEGFVLNRPKTHIMRRGARQEVTGIVVNEHVNLPRDAYDALKATLHNCIRNGAAVENRDGHTDFRAHLDGRIGWAETVNPHRGARLRAMFERITW